MAWTAPTTYTVGQVLTAANVNTYLRDNSNYVAGTDKPHCRVFNSAAQSPTNSTPTALTFDSERVAVGSLHSTASSTTRITGPTGGGGWWAVGGTVAWAANATGVRQMYARVNGSAIFAFDQRNNNTAGDAVRSKSVV